MTSKLILFVDAQYASPYAMSVFVALTVKQMPFELRTVDLALMLNRLVLAGDAVPARLAEYAARQWAHPAVRQWAAFERPPL